MIIVSAFIKVLFFAFIFFIISIIVKHHTKKRIKKKEEGDILLSNISNKPVSEEIGGHKSTLESKIDEIENLYRQKKISKDERDSFISTILNNYTKE
jgi:hypothetical protein